MLAVLGDMASTLILAASLGAYGGRSAVALLLRRWDRGESAQRRRAEVYAWVGVGLMVGYLTWTIVHFILTLVAA